MAFSEKTSVKKANKKIIYTQQQAEELAACWDPVSGPLYFMKNFIWVQHPMRGEIKFEPYPFQLDLIDNYHRFNKSVNLCRQTITVKLQSLPFIYYGMQCL